MRKPCTYGVRARGGPAWVYWMDVEVVDASYQATSVSGPTTWEAAVITVDQGDGPLEAVDGEVAGTLTNVGEDLPQDLAYTARFSADTLSLFSYLTIRGHEFNDFAR